MIDTSSMKVTITKEKIKKAVMYKGIKVQSEDEASDEEKKNKQESSDDSADEYFNN